MTVIEVRRVLVEILPEHYSTDLEYISVHHFNRDNRLRAGKGTHNQKNFIADLIRDCRKSPNIAFYRNTHLIKSTTYKAQNYCFWVFRQSLW